MSSSELKNRSLKATAVTGNRNNEETGESNSVELQAKNNKKKSKGVSDVSVDRDADNDDASVSSSSSSPDDSITAPVSNYSPSPDTYNGKALTSTTNAEEAPETRTASLKISRWLLPFAVDLRALAFFRMAIGIITLHDLAVRFNQFEQFYTEKGVKTLDSHLKDLDGEMIFSLFFACHHDNWQYLFFLISFAVTFLFTIGWKTGLMKYLMWVTCISVQNRMLLGASGGDDLLIGCLFWCLFMPLGERWSLDAALRRNHSPRDSTKNYPILTLPKSQRNYHLSWASAALVLQPNIMYVFSAFLKSGKDWWPEGNALYYALSGMDYVRPFGIWMRENVSLEILRFLTLSTLVAEYFGALLVICPFGFPYVKISGILLFFSFHFGILICLALGNFQYVCFIALFTIFPREVWDAIDKYLVDRPRKQLVKFTARISAAASASSSKRKAKAEKDSSVAEVLPITVVIASPAIQTTSPKDDSHARYAADLQVEEYHQFWLKLQSMLAYCSFLAFDVKLESEMDTPVAKNSKKSKSESESTVSAPFYLIDGQGVRHSHSALFYYFLSQLLPFKIVFSLLGIDSLATSSSVFASFFRLLLTPSYFLWKLCVHSHAFLSYFHSFFQWNYSKPSRHLIHWPHRLNLVRNTICFVMLCYVLLTNLSTVEKFVRDYPSLKFFSKGVGMDTAYFFKLDQRWAMFAPDPYTRVAWTVLRGHLRGNRTALPKGVFGPELAPMYVDVETFDANSIPDFNKPPVYSHKYDNVYMYDYIDEMEGKEAEYHPWAAYYCRKWNEKYKSQPQLQITELDLFFFAFNSSLPHHPPNRIEQDLAWTQDCDPKFVN